MRFSSKVKIFTFLLCSIGMYILTIFSVNAQDRLTDKSQVFINGIGSVRVGMTVEQASKVAGIKMINNGDFGSCSQFKLQDKPEGIEFMATDGIIARVDVYENKRIATVRGARIGDTKARIISLYKGRIQETNSESSSSIKLLKFTPTDRNDKNYRLIFEIYKNRVHSFRSGRLPEVEYSEGCA